MPAEDVGVNGSDNKPLSPLRKEALRKLAADHPLLKTSDIINELLKEIDRLEHEIGHLRHILLRTFFDPPDTGRVTRKISG